MASKRIQRERVLAHLKKYGRLTVREAMVEMNIGCLAKRIQELREEGYPIKTDMVYKRDTKYGVYKLEGNNEQSGL